MFNRQEKIARQSKKEWRRGRRYSRAAVFVGGMLGWLAFPFSPRPLMAQTFVSGSTGADGAFNPTCPSGQTSCTVTVALPPSGVLNYTTVNIPTNITVNFTRNAANSPVTILTTGNFTSSGVIDVSGSSAVGGVPGRGGPGGFDGGLGGTGFGSSPHGTPGLGPGGGQGGNASVGTALGSASGGGYGAQGTANGAAVPGGQTYGVHTLYPLIGGSGGGGAAGGSISGGPAGGGGGGAIVIASSGTITISAPYVLSGISARGGNGAIKSVGPSQTTYSGCGSGGAIRLIANAIVGGGPLIDVRSTCNTTLTGGNGRVRIETFQLSGSLNTASGVTTVSQGLPGPVLPGAGSPSVRIVSIGGVSVPPTPQASYFNPPDATVNPNLANPITVGLQASNVPLGTVIAISVVTEGVAARSAFNSTALAGTFVSSTATANVTLPAGTSVLTVTATFATP